MGEEKRNKIVAAITVNAILLIFIILAVLIAQIVQISVLKRRKNVLVAELQTLVRQLDDVTELEENLKNGLYEDIDSEIYKRILQLRQAGMTSEEILDIIGVAKGEPVLAFVIG